jgi:hypothetical protein
MLHPPQFNGMNARPFRIRRPLLSISAPTKDYLDVGG